MDGRAHETQNNVVALHLNRGLEADPLAFISWTELHLNVYAVAASLDSAFSFGSPMKEEPKPCPDEAWLEHEGRSARSALDLCAERRC